MEVQNGQVGLGMAGMRSLEFHKVEGLGAVVDDGQFKIQTGLLESEPQKSDVSGIVFHQQDAPQGREGGHVHFFFRVEIPPTLCTCYGLSSIVSYGKIDSYMN